MDWKTFDQLPQAEQNKLHDRCGDVAKERLYLWDEASNRHMWRPIGDGDYALLLGSELTAIGMPGYSAHHLWVILPCQVSHKVWRRITDYQRTGVVDQNTEITDIVNAYKEKRCSYRSMVDSLKSTCSESGDWIFARDLLGYKPGWEIKVLEES